jgi:hypothetical protein
MRWSGRGWRSALRTLPAALLLAMVPPAPGAADSELRVRPDSIRIGTFFGGAEVEVSAEIPEGSEAVIEVIGKDIEEQLLRKGRHWDIWMNVGEIDIDGAPCLYLARSTKPARPEPAGFDLPCGYNVVEQSVSFRGDVRGLRRMRIFDEFVKLKESEKLYGVHRGTLQVAQLRGGRSLVQGTFTIPSKAAPGTYDVRLSAFREGRLVESGSGRLEIRLVRLPALLSSLARRHGALYGLLAVGVAVLFGYFTGIVFRGVRGRHKT